MTQYFNSYINFVAFIHSFHHIHATSSTVAVLLYLLIAHPRFELLPYSKPTNSQLSYGTSHPTLLRRYILSYAAP